jgi:hypothetical protein
MIVFLCQKHSICLISQAQRGFLLFFTGESGGDQNPPLKFGQAFPEIF